MSTQAQIAARRASVIARRVEQVPFAQIAAELEVSESTVRADYRRALERSRAERNAVSDLGQAAELASLDAQEAAVWEVLRTRHITVSQGKIVGRFTGFAKDPDTGAVFRDLDDKPIPLYEEIEDDAPVLAAVDRLIKIGERRTAHRGSTSDAVAAAMARKLEGMTAAVRDGPMAQVALRLAAEIDAGMHPRDAAAVTRELRMVVERLEEQSPVRGEGDIVDELGARRVARITGAAG